MYFVSNNSYDGEGLHARSQNVRLFKMAENLKKKADD